MPKVGDIWESYRANEFIVTIDGVESPGISKVAGLSEGEIETVEQPDGGSFHTYKIAGSKAKFESLTLERYCDGSPEDKKFKDWFQLSFKLNRTDQGGSTPRKNGIITKRHNGAAVLMFAFYGAWVKSSKFTDLEAGSANLFKQTIVLEHEGLERVQ